MTARSFMDLALKQAEIASKVGEVPIGCVIVRGGAVIAEAGNRTLRDRDPTAHAEILAVRQAAQALGSERLIDCDLYVTLEPCAMCAGALYWAGIGRLVYGLSEQRLRTFTGNHPENPTLDMPCRDVLASGQRTIEVVGPFLEDEAAALHVGVWE